MLLTLRPDADTDRVCDTLRGMGLWTRLLADGELRAVRIVPPSPSVDAERLRALPGVAAVFLARGAHPRVDAQRRLPMRVGDLVVTGGMLVAGPCSVESEEGVFAAASIAAGMGAKVLRGGAFKPRTSPYAFAGHGAAALDWMRAAADAHGLAVLTEVMSEGDTDAVCARADWLQIGSRNMQNFALLRAVGAAGMPVLLKRGAAATVEEWLLSGEHLLAAGARQVMFCERGVRGFDPMLRNVLDLGSVALLSHALGQPVMVDPSHAAGRRDLVPALVAASLAVGADAVMVEVHPDPGSALSDGPQALGGEEVSAIRGLYAG